MTDELAVSDPELASILGVFNRLAWGEAIPAASATRRPVSPAASGRGARGFGWRRHDPARIGAASGGSGTANAFSRNETGEIYTQTWPGRHAGRQAQA